MKTHHPKLKTTTPRPLFSCGFFRHCTQTALSPTTPNPQTLPLSGSEPPPPPPPPLPPPPSFDPPPRQPPHPDSESSSSSNTTSQSFTQWRFPLPNSPISSYLQPESNKPEHCPSNPPPDTTQKSDPPPPVLNVNLQEQFHIAELQLSTGSDLERVRALHMLERSLVPNPRAAADGQDNVSCPPVVMKGVIGYLKDMAGAKPASKILLALCLVESNRHVAVEAGAVGAVVESLADLEGPAAERALASLELLCTVAEGAAEVRTHALAVPMMVQVMGRMEGRGKEYALSVLAVIFGGSGDGVAVAPPEAMARAVVLAMQGNCSARGRRKGAQLLKTLQEIGRLDLTQVGE
ncbi:unnamed protein product [Ilex paraguariensis]|uniref:U-box domain-containing protein n=1 Tax=Ilex paraguariensis TaxID=185542 RepID=A0ABC8R199_9AQUA